MNTPIPKRDIIDENLFQEDAVGPDLYKENWPYMKKNGNFIYDSVDSIPYKKFPPIALRSHLGNGTVISPKPEWGSILIPSSPLDHEDKHFKGRKISDILLPLIVGTAEAKKYIASARSWYFFFAEMQYPNYETIFKISQPNEIIPFILFDETLSYCFGFDFDFEYSFFSSPNLKEEQLNGTFSEWDEYFIDNFVKTAPRDTYHMALWEKILRPSVPRLNIYQ